MSAPGTAVATKDRVAVIEPVGGWRLFDWQELKEYRDLFFFLIFRDIKVLYAQTVLGFLWAILNPLIQIAIFTIIFGGVAQIDLGESGDPVGTRFLVGHVCRPLDFRQLGGVALHFREHGRVGGF